MSSECSSIPDAKFFNEKYTYPHWFTRKKLIFHNKMLKRLRKLRFLHSRSSQYYDKQHIILSAPAIIITSVSGIASFLSTSQYIEENTQNAFGITVGVLASLSSIFQALSAAFQYSVKREAHRTVAEQYNSLIVKTKFEMEMPNEEDFIDKLEQSILDIQSKCNYFVPQFILDEWSKTEEAKNINSSNDNMSINNNMNMNIFNDESNNTHRYNDNGIANSYNKSPESSRSSLNSQNNKTINKQTAEEHISINIKPSEKTYLLNKNNISEIESDNKEITELRGKVTKYSDENINELITDDNDNLNDNLNDKKNISSRTEL